MSNLPPRIGQSGTLKPAPPNRISFCFFGILISEFLILNYNPL